MNKFDEIKYDSTLKFSLDWKIQLNKEYIYIKKKSVILHKYKKNIWRWMTSQNK